MAKKRPALRSLSAMDIPTDLTDQLVQRIQDLRPSVKTDYLKSEILSKYVSPTTEFSAEQRRDRAIFKWLCTEMENEATNDRLLITPEEYNILPRVPFGNFTDFCRDFIRDIIGETPPLEALIGTFSGGASTSRTRTKSHPATKYLGEAHVTARAAEIWEIISPEMPGWLAEQDAITSVVVPGNVMFTVPKKTDIDRVACKEPDLNMFMQKGIGSHIRACLLRNGINLNDQSINRSLALEGSVTNNLATLDLSSASDSVTYELVAQLLPESWFTLLDAVRSQVTIINGEEHQNHMFSSMGNGFTFELESLLFFTIAKATAFFTGTRGRISVYGDDIICPSDMAHSLTWTLQWFGFSVNTEKSFYEGPFRESCGGHYHLGLDITPFYLKEPISDLPGIIHAANSLRKWAEIKGTSILDPEVESIWLWLKAMIPSNLWGGADTAFKYQLVSYDSPLDRIREETVSKETRLGGYYHWLNTTWDRSGLTFHEALEDEFYKALGHKTAGELRRGKYGRLPNSVQTSRFVKGDKRLRLSPVRSNAVARLSALFYHEVCDTSE